MTGKICFTFVCFQEQALSYDCEIEEILNVFVYFYHSMDIQNFIDLYRILTVMMNERAQTYFYTC